MYEIVLRFPDHEEVRFTDRAVAVGDTIEVGNQQWRVVVEREPEAVRATARFLCELTATQRRRAVEMGAADAERRERMKDLEQRRRALDEKLLEDDRP